MTNIDTNINNVLIDKPQKINKNKKTTEEFIKEAIQFHGDKYDYSKTVYITSKNKVTIICKTHGEFTQIASEHLKAGCRFCGGTGRKTTEMFIADAMKTHKDKYDYSKVNYKNNSTPITIICKTHGDFTQQAKEHLKYGCSRCAGNKKKTTEEFTADAIEKHGDIYDYSKVKYKNNNIHITIICKTHGEFQQTPAHHLEGNKCPQCHFEYLSKIKTKTTEQFINEAIEVHGDKYDYSKVDYKDSLSNVIIICKTHNYEFLQTPNNHIRGSNCHKCSRTYCKTKEEVIEESKKIHGDKFDYSNIGFINMANPIQLYCKIIDKEGNPHGTFNACPVSHLSGRNCRKCAIELNAKNQSHTLEQFIEKANIIHENKYDYSKSVYVNCKTKW